MKMTHRALGVIAVLLLLFPFAVFAQKSARARGPFRGVEIVVKDLASGREIGTIPPGGSFTLAEGQRVRLIMTAVHPGHGQEPYYPETEFIETEPGRGWVRVTRTNVENSNATVEIVRPGNFNRNRTEALRYRIVENIDIPRSLRTGAVTIRVAFPEHSVYPPLVPGNRTAEEITNRLYRAILMRDMDQSGQQYADRIARGGYPALIQVADEIARSEESRIHVYEWTRATQEQRLSALYQNLLGLNSSQIDQTQWRNDLSLLHFGRIAEVVARIVHSERFQDYNNLYQDRTAIRYH